MKFFIVLGEDKMYKHATAKLAKQLKRLDTRAEFKDSGGLLLNDENTGLQKHKPLKFRISKKIIKEFKPDILILFGVSNKERRLAAFARKKGIKTCYYSLPDQSHKVSIHTVRRIIDKVLVTHPNEEKLYNSDTVQAEFVGNPLVDLIKDHEFDET